MDPDPDALRPPSAPVEQFLPVAPPPRPPSARPRLAGTAVALSVFLLATALAAGLWTYTDLDHDELRVQDEWRHATDPIRDDTDQDGVPDGWELVRSLDPLHPDTDEDALNDRAELDNATNPRSADTDDDGTSDAIEGLTRDCNANGVLAAREDDDDGDQRMDTAEPEAHRCDADVDDDGVLDGQERNRLCIVVPDCDLDGLDDEYERNTSFDPLNPDSFGVGLEDAILDAFQRRGQPPSGDQDEDGIPDGWEGNNGLIQWGAFTPTNTTRDMLVEFVRVLGPDSARHSGLSFEPAYNLVRDVFRNEANIRLQWIETRVTIPTEQVPALIPSSESAYYHDILNRSAYATNPYVTTVVMNPQHDQRQLLHAGVAPIRGMLAAVDYGVHVTFRYQLDGQNLYMMPLLESAIQANRLDVVRAFGWQTGGYQSNGEMYVDAGEFNVVWRPYWFRTVPRIITDEGDTIPLSFHSATVDQSDLAFTILHEIGHTLGLCHLDLPDCLEGIAAADRPGLATSTMHPSSTGLHFLPSEWTNAGRYMTCPAHGPIRILADQGSATELIDEKYGYALEDILDVGLRECGDFTSLAADLEPDAAVLRYDPPAADRDAPHADASPANTYAYIAASLGYAATLSLVGGALTARRLRMR